MKDNFESNTNFKELICLINELQDFIHSKRKEIQVDSGDTVKSFYLHVLERFDINITALVELLKIYIHNPKVKLPLSLILRAVNSDFLTILYLSTFLDKDHIGVKNELKIFQKDYVSFMEEFGNEEQEFNLKYYPERKESIEKSEFHLKELHKDYPDLYKKTNKGYFLKSNYEIRESTPNFHFPDEKQRKQPRLFLSEAYKYRRLKLINRDIYGAQAFLVFKYYSQFQHISPLSSYVLDFNHKILDNKFLLMSVENLLVGVNLILKIVTGDGSESEIGNLIARLRKLVN